MSDPYAVATQPAAPSWLDEAAEPESLRIGEEWDDDYVEAKEPEVDEVLEVADELLGEHQLRLGQAREMDAHYDGNDPGFFKEDAEDIANDVVETLSISTLRQMLDFRSGLIAMHEPYPRLLNREAIDRDEAMAIEELIAYDFRCEERQYARRFGADLRLTEPANLQRYGMLVGLDVLDPTDVYCGLNMQLIDPLTVYPVFGDAQGVEEVYRIYDSTPARVAGAFGGKPGSTEYARLRGILDDQVEDKKTRTGTVTIRECTNRDWTTVVVGDDKKLLSRKHGYHRNPYTVVVGAFDKPANVSSGTNSEVESITLRGVEIPINDRSADTARLLRPFDWKRLATHRAAEAIAGRQLTAFKESRNPAMVEEFDPLQKKHQVQIGALAGGARIRVPIPNKLTVVTPIVDPTAMAGLNMAMAANAQTGVLGQLAGGSVPPQTSGSALNSMMEIGGASDAVLVRLIQLFKTLRAEQRLWLRLHFGGMLGKQGDRGVISVPSRPGYTRTPMHRVTPDMIERTGTDAEVTLYNHRPDVAAAQYFSTLRAPHAVTGLPLISDETARRHLRLTADPDREADRIDDEQLQALPAIRLQRNIARVEIERDMALEEGDTSSADKANAAVMQMQYELEQMILSGQAPPTQAAPPAAGGPPEQPAPPEPGGPVMPGNSLPEMGIGVGQQGGRPIEEPPANINPVAPPAMSPVGGPRDY